MSEVTGSKARKKVYCDVCSTFVSSESLLAVHNNGKKHQRLLKALAERQASAERSLYVRGFSSTGLLESDLHDYFCKFGNVSSIFVDKEKAKYAIVEYQCPTEAQTVLASKDLPLFHGKHLIIKRRSVKEPQANKPPQSSCSRSKRLPGVEKVSNFLNEDVMHRIKEAKTFDDQMRTLVSATSLTEDDNKLRRLIVQYLQEILVEVFPGCEVVPFGSSSTGLGLSGADLDLCLLVDPTYLEHLEELDESGDCSFPNNITDQLQFIVRLLRQFAAGFQNVVPVVSAKCPLVKFVHRDSELSCDLSINNRLATRNTELIKSYVALDDRIRPLAMTLKNWARAKRLSGSGGRQISNYALVLMLLHFLQRTRPAVIPVLQHIRGNETMSCKDGTVAEKTMIDGWDCSFATRLEMEESPNQESLGDLLKEWFCYYGNTFDFGNEVITVHNGNCKRVLKHDIAENIIQTSEKPNIFKITPLCVQDPFELSHNLTQSVPVEVLRRFIQSCMDAHSTLSPNPTETSTASSSSTSKEAFLDLFTVPTDVTTKPQKVVYSFAMPLLSSTSKHKESETTADQLQRTCEFIMDTLTRDLQVSCELQSSECTTPIQNAVESSWTEISGSEGKHVGEIKHSGSNEEACQFSRKRPREEERPTERTNVKKVKSSDQSENTSFLLHCKASTITWQHRRRQRRLRTQSENARNDADVDSGLTNTVENGGNCSANESTKDAMDIEETELNQTQLHKSPEKLNANSSYEHTSPSAFNKNAESNSQPLIEFTVKIGERSLEIGKRVCGECFVVLSYLDGSIHHFANFYAFFKKYVITKSAEHRVIKASD